MIKKAMLICIFTIGYVGHSVEPARAEIGCKGKLNKGDNGFYSAKVLCTNTESSNQGYACSGTWRLLTEDNLEGTLAHGKLTVVKGAVDAVLLEENRLNGKKIKGQAHPYEGTCELK